MEYIDIVNDKGELTGQSESRDSVHQKGLLHRHIHVWIINSNNEVLLQRRSPNKKTYANMWAMSAEGHVSAGKSLEETVIDEVREELNIILSPKQLKLEFSYTRGRIEFANNWVENGINYVYIVKNDTPLEKITIQESEVSDVKWMKLNDYKIEVENENSEYRLYPKEYSLLFKLIK